ncbi:protein artichoke-like [Lytechinus variegatus]|uniref:protein artichoke-like n=1 Tax=Lytechinus variegatus TaxID=7654 RepID=UPI001BB0FBD8|nr:protein artichoke-like [Lytechinus variegatus]
MYVQNNKIKTLNFDDCSEWSHLSNIYVSNNEIVEIHQRDFLPLQSLPLSYLFINGNKINMFPREAFYHLNLLRLIKLDSNTIESFDIQPFLGMDFIARLSVKDGKISKLLPPQNTTNKEDHLYPTIISLDIANNLIESVPPNSFWGFPKLQILNLTRNKISILVNKSFCQMQSLFELNLSSNKIMFLPNNTFACLSCLKILNLMNNLLQSIYPESFNGLPRIQSVLLSHNSIKYLNRGRQAWTLRTLQSIDFSFNDITSIGKDSFTGLINLKDLILSYNQIYYFYQTAFSELFKLSRLHLTNERKIFLEKTFKQLHSLTFLDLSNSPIKISRYQTEQFRNLTRLQELRMEMAQLSNTDLYNSQRNESLFTGLCSLQKLNLKDNSLMNLDRRVFQALSNLRYLDMTNSRIKVLKSGIFSPLSSLRGLYLGSNELQKIPGDIFYGLHDLTVVKIQNNRIFDLDPRTFAQNPRLDILYLSGNQITNIKPGTVLPSNSPFNLDLSRNPITCSCSLAWFRKWLELSNVNFKNANQAICSGTSLKGLASKPILSFHPDDHCGINIVLILVLSFSGVLVGIMIIIAYTKRWWLNHKFFLLKLAIVGYKEMTEEFNDVNYRHHLNIMFQESEQEWIDRVMKPGLEARMPHLQNIIFGDEDLHIGMYYINAIFDALDNSFKTVLLLSNESINDAWTMTKVRMALEYINDTGLDKIILIFVEDIEDENMPYLVRLFLSRNKPYMLWTDDEDGQELFWAQFEKSMRANKAINNAIPL